MTTEDLGCLTNKTDYTPYRKVGAGGIAGALTTLLVLYLTSQTGLEIEPDVVAAITTLLTFFVAYMVPENPKRLRQ